MCVNEWRCCFVYIYMCVCLFEFMFEAMYVCVFKLFENTWMCGHFCVFVCVEVCVLVWVMFVWV